MPGFDDGPLARLLRPRSVAVVGASADPRSFGGFVQGNLDRLGYAGALHLVSRGSVEIAGRPCVRTVDELPAGLDVAVLAIPEAGVADALTALAARGCRHAVVFASGYAETGDEGRARQQALQRLAGAMYVLGPNCMGCTDFETGTALTFEPLAPYPCGGRPGIAIAAQSGFMAATLREAFVGRGAPIVWALSTGNEAGIVLEDAVEQALVDPQVRVLALYAEQFRQPRRLLQLARRARERGLPIVLLMPGRSERGAAAAASHTGALAGDHALASALLRREAVLVAQSLDELFDCTAILLRHPQASPGGAAFVTGSGAMKNLALDAADAAGLALPDLRADTTAGLRAMLPAFAVAENPLDYTTIGVRQPGLIGQIVHRIAADPGIGAVALAIPAGPPMAQRDKADHIVPALAAAPKPALLVVTGDEGALEPFFREAIAASGVPLFRSADRALRALTRVQQRAADMAVAQRADLALVQPDETNAARPLPRSGAPGVATLAEHAGKAWLQSIGIAVPAGGLARDADAAVAQAARIGWPVVLKAQAAALAHKSDAGAVALNLADEAALRAAWAQLEGNVQRHRPGLVLDGMLVEAMAPRGLELVLGARRDPDWGVVLLLGLGGIWIETLRDRVLLSPDLAATDIEAALRCLQAAALLAGSRGQPAVSTAAIAAAARSLGRAVMAEPSLREVDLNPLVAYPDRVLALDALLVVDTAVN